MKLFSLPDGTVGVGERAQWLTCPFDLAFATSTDPRSLLLCGRADVPTLAGRVDVPTLSGRDDTALSLSGSR